MSTAISGSKLGSRLILAAVIALAIVWIAPLVWVFALSFKPNEFLSVRTDVLFSPPFTLAVALVLLFAADVAFTSTPLVAVTFRSISATTVSVATVRPIEAPTATLLPSVWPVAVVVALPW